MFTVIDISYQNGATLYQLQGLKVKYNSNIKPISSWSSLIVVLYV